MFLRSESTRPAPAPRQTVQILDFQAKMLTIGQMDKGHGLVVFAAGFALLTALRRKKPRRLPRWLRLVRIYIARPIVDICFPNTRGFESI